MTQNEFLEKIENFLEKTGMSASAFGAKAMHNPCFVADIRSGRQCLDSTKERALNFINTYEKEQD